jgi:hypothetical protein
MSKDLEEELRRGDEACRSLADHRVNMGGNKMRRHMIHEVDGALYQAVFTCEIECVTDSREAFGHDGK